MSAAKPIIIPIVILCVIVMIMEGFAHAPWFKCNDVIRYGVWQWCASYVYFRYTLGKNDEDIYMSRRIDSVIDNNHYCHGYSEKLFEESNGVPVAITIGRVFLVATHAVTLLCLTVLLFAYGDRISGLIRKWSVLMTSILQFSFFSVFCISMEAYLDSLETGVNRTVVCWNGILAWIGWCVSVIQVIAAIVYFVMDDGEVDEILMYDEQVDTYNQGPSPYRGAYEEDNRNGSRAGYYPNPNPNSNPNQYGSDYYPRSGEAYT